MQIKSKTELSKQYLKWQAPFKSLNIRGLVICHPQSLVIEVVKTHLREQQLSFLCLDNDAQGRFNKSDKVDLFLGGETHALFFDASQYFDPNLFAAVSGTLIGGATLFLVVDETTFEWAQHVSRVSNDRQNTTEDEKTARHSRSDNNRGLNPIIERLIRFSINNATTAIADIQGFHPIKTCDVDPQLQPQDPGVNEIGQAANRRKTHPEALQSNKTPILNEHTNFSEQQQLIPRIIRVARGHANRPLVITANRGRGKSASLGIAAAQLVIEKPTHIIVSAPNKNNLASFYKHLALSLKQSQPQEINGIENLLSTLSLGAKFPTKLALDNGSTIEFVAVDQIIHQQPLCNLLLIDEAAAIPVNQLKIISKLYNRLVFSTTTDGFEGNGQGFEIRFKKQLLSLKPATQFASLSQPIRWSKLDQLEPATYQALLLQSQLTEISEHQLEQIRSAKNQPLFEVKLLSKSQLRLDEPQLETIFSLLINAHYQTRPADLQAILEDRNLDVITLQMDTAILGVALISLEGELGDSMTRQICESEKRLPGQLLPQSLISNFGLVQAGSMHFYRILRIAVHPQLHNLGLGSQLIAHINQRAKNHGIDFVGASFAATYDVTHFWFKNNFRAIRFGQSKDSSSGSHSLEVLCPLSTKAHPILAHLTHRFSNAFMVKLHSFLADLDIDLITSVFLTQVSFEPVDFSDIAQAEVKRFSQGKRGLSSVIELIQALLISKIQSLANDPGWTINEINFLVASILLQIELTQLAKDFGFSGKKACLAHLRALTAKLVN